MSVAYGRGKYGLGKYGGRTDYLVPGGRGAAVTAYKPDGSIRAQYQTGVGKFLSVDFGHDEGGCATFALNFSGYVNISKNDVVKITIMDSDDCFYTGVVRGVPIDGSTKSDWSYTGFGLNDYLVRLNTGDRTFAATTVEAVVRTLAQAIDSDTPVTYDPAKVAACTVSITSITLHYASMKDALDQLKKLADSDGNTYLFGVDKDGYFFFQPRSEDLMATLAVGKMGWSSIERYEPEDKTEYRTKLYVLDKDGTYVTTVQDLSEGLDIYEEKATAPDIDVADVPAWAAGVLAQRNRDTRQATIEWKVREHHPLVLVADGSIRIISNVIDKEPGEVVGTTYGEGTYGSGYYGGAVSYPGRDLDDTLEVRAVTYSVTSQGAMMTIELGSVPADISRRVAKLINHVKDMETSLGI